MRFTVYSSGRIVQMPSDSCRRRRRSEVRNVDVELVRWRVDVALCVAGDVFFFFLMNRRPPISPLFPYPPLFRSCRHSSSRDVAPIARAVRTHGCRIAASTDPAVRRATRGARNQASVNAGRTRLAGRSAPMLGRSEEHTSELQSRLHLVCRLLLEK